MQESPASSNKSADNEPKGMGVSATRGVFWVGGGQVFRQVLGVLTSIILARLLGPGEFGLIAMAYIFIELAQLFADFGIGAAVIQTKDIRPTVLSSAFWANTAVGLGLMALMLMAAPFAGLFFENESVGPVLAVLSFTLLLSGMNVVPRATLHKAMRFDLSIKAQMAGSATGTAVAILMAYSGAGVWSLVAQPLCGSTVTLVLTIFYARWKPLWIFSWASIRELARFSADVLGSSLANYAATNGDKLLVGKFIGSSALGLYSLAYQLMLYPMTHVASVIVKVLFPTLSAMQEDLPRFRKAFLKSTAAVAVFTFPVMTGLLIVSEDFVNVVFGEKWLEMVPVLQILCLVGMVKSVATTAGTIYLSMARTRALLNFSLVMMVLSLAAYVIGLPWGIIGVALGFAAVSFLMLYVYLGIAFRAIHLSFSEFHAALARPLAASIMMAGIVWMVRAWFLAQTDATALMRLIWCVIFGFVLYAAVSLVVNRTQLTQLIRISLGAMKSSKSTSE